MRIPIQDAESALEKSRLPFPSGEAKFGQEHLGGGVREDGQKRILVVEGLKD